MADVFRFPDEIILRIFRFYLQTETQSNFIRNVSRVCQQWNRVAKDSSLFNTVDGSLRLQEIVHLAKAGALKKITTLEFGELTKQKEGQYKTIYTNCPQLTRLDISNVCPKLKGRERHPILTEIVGLCPNLCELVLNPTYKDRYELIPSEMFTHIVLVRGPNFVKLDFSNALWLNLTKLFLHIAEHCPNLEELLADGGMENRLINTRFPVTFMQKRLPKLKSLCLGPCTIFEDLSPTSPGFPNLEKFTYACRCDADFNSTTLWALLFNSPNLKILNFKGCFRVLHAAVVSLPAKNLEEIYFSNTFRRGSPAIFQKWSHSLEVIEMSYERYTGNIDGTFLPDHFPNGLPKLQALDVHDTGITDHGLMVIIQHSPNLRYLKVRGKEIYRSRSKIEELLSKLEGNEMDCS